MASKDLLVNFARIQTSLVATAMKVSIPYFIIASVVMLVEWEVFNFKNNEKNNVV